MKQSENRTNSSVLCLEKNPQERTGLTELIRANDYNVLAASSLGEALEWLTMNPAQVVLVDQEGVGDLVGALKSIRKVNPGGVILLIKEGRNGNGENRAGQVFEVIEKPVVPEVLVGHLGRAFTFYREMNATIYYQSQNEDRMRYQLEWLLWKQKTRIQEKMDFTRVIIDSIRHSITQGLGIGSVVTLGELMEMNRISQEDGRYSISTDIVDAMVASARMLDSWLQALEGVYRDFEQKYSPEILSGEILVEIVDEVLEKVEGLRKIKNHGINVSDLQISRNLEGNRAVLEIALRELLINAMKYSPENSGIDIIRYKSGESYTLAVLNDILPMAGGICGIPDELENQIFEPFYRLNNMFDERFQTGRCGMGLGLTMVQNLLNQIGARLFIHEANDFLNHNGTKRIVAEIILPVVPDHNEESSKSRPAPLKTGGASV